MAPVSLNICFYQPHPIACSHGVIFKLYARFYEILLVETKQSVTFNIWIRNQFGEGVSRTESDMPGQSIVFDNSFDRRNCPLKSPSGPELRPNDKEGFLGAARFGNPSEITEHIRCSYTLLDSLGRGGKGLSANEGLMVCAVEALPSRSGSLGFLCQVNIFGSLLSEGIAELFDCFDGRFCPLSECRKFGLGADMVSPGSKRS